MRDTIAKQPSPLFLVALTACGGASASTWFAPPASNATDHRATATPIEHDAIIVQENRSFDNFFYESPGANYAKSGKGHDGRTVGIPCRAKRICRCRIRTPFAHGFSRIVIIMWDERGGWYDHVLPPQYPDSQTGAYEGLGYRVPSLRFIRSRNRRHISARIFAPEIDY